MDTLDLSVGSPDGTSDFSFGSFKIFEEVPWIPKGWSGAKTVAFCCSSIHEIESSHALKRFITQLENLFVTLSRSVFAFVAST